jgi:hypothetical protein
MVATLPAGNYTGIVRGKGNATGVALVEGAWASMKTGAIRLDR